MFGTQKKEEIDSLARWNCKYRIVFAPKYRRQAIYGQIRTDIGSILLQRMALRLPGRVFLHLKDVPVDARDLHRNIAQTQLRLPEGNIDANVGIAPITL